MASLLHLHERQHAAIIRFSFRRSHPSTNSVSGDPIGSEGVQPLVVTSPLELHAAAPVQCHRPGLVAHPSL